MKHPFVELIGLQIDSMENGASHCTLPVEEKIMNPQGVVHGAAIYALADTGMGAALAPGLGEGEICATIEIKMNYYRPVSGGIMTCETEVINRGKSVTNMESSIYSEGKLVARANGNYSIFVPSKRL